MHVNSLMGLITIAIMSFSRKKVLKLSFLKLSQTFSAFARKENGGFFKGCVKMIDMLHLAPLFKKLFRSIVCAQLSL